MSFEQLKNRGCPRFQFIGPAFCKDYKLDYVGHSSNWNLKGTANLTKKLGRIVWGGLFYLDDQCISQLNLSEHVPEKRKQLLVKVQVPRKKPISAVAFVVKSDLEPNKPSEEYLAVVMQGAKDCQLPDEYIQQL